MLFALVSALFTQVSADTRDLRRVFGVARAEARAGRCDVCDITAQADTACQVLIPGLDTLVGAPLADLDGFETLVDTVLHFAGNVDLVYSHGMPPCITSTPSGISLLEFQES